MRRADKWDYYHGIATVFTWASFIAIAGATMDAVGVTSWWAQIAIIGGLGALFIWRLCRLVGAVLADWYTDWTE